MKKKLVYKRVTAKMRSWLTAYAAKACNVSEACKAIGISRQTSGNWTRGSKEFAALRTDVEESMIDLAESKLMQMIEKGDNLGALCFFLKCKGKHRGYVEKSEHTHDGNVSLTVNRVPLAIKDKSTDDRSDS